MGASKPFHWRRSASARPHSLGERNLSRQCGQIAAFSLQNGRWKRLILVILLPTFFGFIWAWKDDEEEEKEATAKLNVWIQQLSPGLRSNHIHWALITWLYWQIRPRWLDERKSVSRWRNSAAAHSLEIYPLTFEEEGDSAQPSTLNAVFSFSKDERYVAWDCNLGAPW